MHAYVAWFLTARLVLHVVAALRHHLILDDDVLLRMSPKRGTSAPPKPVGSPR